MIFNAVSLTLKQLFSPPFRSVLWKSIGLTIVLFIGAWFLFDALATAFIIPLIGAQSWIVTTIAWVLGISLVLVMGFLIAPVTSVFAGVFLDEIAEAVEKDHYPTDTPGTALTLSQSVGITARFLSLVLIANLIALLLVIFLGLGFIIFFLVNGYLLGREYFQFAALRHRSAQEVDALREKHGFSIFIAGLAIAVVLSIPIVNLLTPLFAGALMVHVFKTLEQKA
jgi:CysZ protein